MRIGPDKLASGAFGSVYFAKYAGDAEVTVRNVVIKKLKSDTKHPNIPNFVGFSGSPHAIMMEYERFSLSSFGAEKVISNLEDF